MWLSLDLGYWLTLVLAVPTAGLLVRLFVFAISVSCAGLLPASNLTDCCVKNNWFRRTNFCGAWPAPIAGLQGAYTGGFPHSLFSAYSFPSGITGSRCGIGRKIAAFLAGQPACFSQSSTANLPPYDGR